MRYTSGVAPLSEREARSGCTPGESPSNYPTQLSGPPSPWLPLRIPGCPLAPFAIAQLAPSFPPPSVAPPSPPVSLSSLSVCQSVSVPSVWLAGARAVARLLVALSETSVLVEIDGCVVFYFFLFLSFAFVSSVFSFFSFSLLFFFSFFSVAPYRI